MPAPLLTDQDKPLESLAAHISSGHTIVGVHALECIANYPAVQLYASRLQLVVRICPSSSVRQLWISLLTPKNAMHVAIAASAREWKVD